MPTALAAVLDLDCTIRPEVLAANVAERVGWAQPTRRESIEIIVSLTLHVCQRALDMHIESDHELDLLSTSDWLGIPELGEDRWMSQILAAKDLGLLDLPLRSVGYGPPVRLLSADELTAKHREGEAINEPPADGVPPAPTGASEESIAQIFGYGWTEALNRWAHMLVDELIDQRFVQVRPY